MQSSPNRIPQKASGQPRQLILAGAGHSHLEVLEHMDEYSRRNCEVTLVAPEDFFYSGMGPGVLSGTYHREANRMPTSAIAQTHGGRYFCDKVSRIDAQERAVELAGGRRLSYDLLSVNIGSEVKTAGITGTEPTLWQVKPISNLTRLHDHLKERAVSAESIRLVVAGGGAAGCEIAMNLWHLLHAHGVMPAIRIVTPGGILLKRHGKRASACVAKEMRRLGIQVLDNRVVRANAGSVELNDGTRLACDLLVQATGVCPPAVLRESGLPTAKDGSLLVNQHLQSVEYPEIFGAGDCIGFKEHIPHRVGVHAVRESKYLHGNLLARLEDRDMRSYTVRDRYLLILNLGDRRGLLLWRNLAFRGSWAFWLKNRLDRGFMKRMQP